LGAACVDPTEDLGDGVDLIVGQSGHGGHDREPPFDSFGIEAGLISEVRRAPPRRGGAIAGCVGASATAARWTAPVATVHAEMTRRAAGRAGGGGCGSTGFGSVGSAGWSTHAAAGWAGAPCRAL